MPQRVNGCGTWYYGKKNVQSTFGTCRICRREATLTSYDTRLFVSLLFMPVIPLGRKHILDQCGACGRHFAISQKEWDAANQRLRDTVDAYKRSPGNKQLAEEALRACVGQRDVNALNAMGPGMEKDFADNDKALCIIASAYIAMNQGGNAERALRAAVAVKNDDDASQMLGGLLTRMGRLTEAEPYLQHIIDKGIPDRVDALYHLAQGFQAKGDHAKALEWFAHCEFVNPTIVDDATFKKLKGLSEKNLGTNVAVKSGAVLAKDRAAKARKRSLKALALILIVVAVGYVIVAAFEGARRKVYLVNGLSRAYTARLNGKAFALAPHSVTPVRLAEGDINVEIPDAAGAGAQVAPIRTDFLSRPFDNRVYVINPDGSAILEKIGVTYSSQVRLPGMESNPMRSYYAGQVLHQFNDIDYAFVDPPHSIQVERNKDVMKNVLILGKESGEVSVIGVLSTIQEAVGKEAVWRVAQQHVQLEPPALGYLQYLEATMPPGQQVECLRPMLGRRPVELEIHRAYQDALTAMGQGERVVAEYGKMLAAEPGDKNLMYLAARHLRDVDKSMGLCQKACEGDKPCPYAFYSLGSYYYEVARFPESLANLKRAAELLPKHADVEWYLKASLIANGRYDEARQLIREEEMGPVPECLVAFYDEVNLLALMNKRSDADDIPLRLKPRLRGMAQGALDQQLAQLASVTEYCFGNPYQASKLLRSAATDANDRFELYLLQGNPDDAERELAAANANPNAAAPGNLGAGADGAKAWLILYIAACVQNRPEVAERYVQKAVEGLEKGTFEDQAYAAALKSAQGPAPADLLRLRQNPIDKRVMLTALGLRKPAARNDCFALANKLNIDRRFPHLLIQAAINEPAH